MRPRVVVVGLGPATPDLVTTATVAAIERISRRYLRTRRHPSAGIVPDAHDFDHLYTAAATFDEVYDGIVEQLVEAAREHGEVLYAVPGSPTVAEAAVERVRAHPEVEVEVLPAVSFLDLAWSRLGLDPVDAGIRLVDAYRFDVDAAGERGPLLVAQCDNRQVLSDIKLAIADTVHQPLVVTVLQRLGLPDEHLAEVPWTELDRSFEPDHLTSVFVPRLAAPISGEVAAFAAVVRRLRADCPWDREQTHASLRRHLLEESYEVLEALDHLDPDSGEGADSLEEELGDLLFQIVFHSTLAAEEGHFDLADVARGIREKLVARHPHVFGDVAVDSVEELTASWEQMKKAEKGRASVMDGIPATLPALLYALKVQKKAATAGVDWRELTESDDAGDLAQQLLALVGEAAAAGIDPESALRIATERIRDKVQAHERSGASSPG
ncbi:MAG TPA: MazG family protein [Acidimicrobiales bacterium]